MALGELYDRFQAIITLEHRVQVLEEHVASILPRMEELSLALVRLGGRIETVKAETMAEFYRQMAGASSPPSHERPARPALPSPRRRRSR